MKHLILILMIALTPAFGKSVAHCPLSYTCVNGTVCGIDNPADEQNGLFPENIGMSGKMGNKMTLSGVEIEYGTTVLCKYGSESSWHMTLIPKVIFIGKQLSYTWNGDVCKTGGYDAWSGCQFYYKKK